MRRFLALGCLGLFSLAGAVCAQQQAPPPPQLPDRPRPQRATDSQSSARIPAAPHRFWDKQNAWLFAGVAASRALDFHSTGNMRRRGRNEILLTNAMVDNKPSFAAIELGGAAASIGISYLFHRAGHHKLERWVSYLHIGVSTFGAVRNYSLSSYRAPAPASPVP